MANFQDTGEVIDFLGGNQAVADLMGTTSKAISNWRIFGAFPAASYLVIQDALRQQGRFAPDHLWAFRQPATPPKKKNVSA